MSDASTSPPKAMSKKIIFLYPHSVVQEQMISLLIQSEYEVALMVDHQKALRVLDQYKSTIIFCNIDDTHLKNEEWEAYIKGIVENGAKNDARVGILTYDPSPEQAQKYLMDIMVPCGYIGLKLGLRESTKIMLKMLDANEAKGGRRFIRVRCPVGKSVISLRLAGRDHNGTIIDLSSAGLACYFEDKPAIKTQNSYNDIQLQLWGARLRESMTLMGTREQDGRLVHIFMFDEFANHDSKSKLYTFVRKAIQMEIDAV